MATVTCEMCGGLLDGTQHRGWVWCSASCRDLDLTARDAARQSRRGQPRLGRRPRRDRPRRSARPYGRDRSLPQPWTEAAA